MTFKNMLAGVAAIGLATAPVAATAGTRAADALPTMATADMTIGARTTQGVKKDEQFLSGSGGIYAGLFILGFAALLYFAIDDDDGFDRTD